MSNNKTKKGETGKGLSDKELSKKYDKGKSIDFPKILKTITKPTK